MAARMDNHPTFLSLSAEIQILSFRLQKLAECMDHYLPEPAHTSIVGGIYYLFYKENIAVILQISFHIASQM